MIRRTILTLTAVIACLWLTACVPGQFGRPQNPTTSVTCYEDQACWNPAEMGNGLGYIAPGR